MVVMELQMNVKSSCAIRRASALSFYKALTPFSGTATVSEFSLAGREYVIARTHVLDAAVWLILACGRHATANASAPAAGPSMPPPPPPPGRGVGDVADRTVAC